MIFRAVHDLAVLYPYLSAHLSLPFLPAPSTKAPSLSYTSVATLVFWAFLKSTLLISTSELLLWLILLLGVFFIWVSIG